MHNSETEEGSEEEEEEEEEDVVAVRVLASLLAVVVVLDNDDEEEPEATATEETESAQGAAGDFAPVRSRAAAESAGPADTSEGSPALTPASGCWSVRLQK